jgi:hypothetical protein
MNDWPDIDRDCLCYAPCPAHPGGTYGQRCHAPATVRRFAGDAVGFCLVCADYWMRGEHTWPMKTATSSK